MAGADKLINLNKQQGVTLVELMIAVGILGILAAVVLPSYQQHVITSSRTAATACLAEYAQFMERNYTTNMSYNSFKFT